MLVNIVSKYGLVPKSAMPESVPSSATHEMDIMLTEKLRGFACALRRMHAEGKSDADLRTAREEMLDTIL